MSNTITENLEELKAADYLLHQLETLSPEDGAPSQPITYTTPDVSLMLQYNSSLYHTGDQRDLNSPTITFQFTEEDYTKLPEYISWLIDLTMELVAETTNNDACGWSIDIQTRNTPQQTITITVTDDLS